MTGSDIVALVVVPLYVGVLVWFLVWFARALREL